VETTNAKKHATGLVSVDPVQDPGRGLVLVANLRPRICRALPMLLPAAALVAKSSRVRRTPVWNGATKKSVET
jgi:hypothetical protein